MKDDIKLITEMANWEIWVTYRTVFRIDDLDKIRLEKDKDLKSIIG